MMLLDGKTQIGTLRIHTRGAGVDPLSVKMRTESFLRGANLDPLGLSPSAIVCIRKFRDPSPSALRLRPNEIRPPLEWEQAVASSLGQMIRRAARPFNEMVPANAEAVIFADRAELLACLARDWCGGSFVGRWWWHGLFKRKDIYRMVLNEWLDSPEYIPQALQYLAEKRSVLPFIHALGINEARELLRGIVRVFSLHDLRSALDVFLMNGPVMTEAVREQASMSVGHWSGPVPRSTRKSQAAPWLPWATESAEGGMRLEQECLLGVGLMLVRAPAEVRKTSFAHEVFKWSQAEHETEDHFILDTAGIPPERLGDKKRALSAASEDSSYSAETNNSIIKGIEHTDAVPQTQGSVSMPDEMDLPAQTPSSAKAPEAEWAHEETVETEFGGLFYLINLGIFLNLYGDFTTPAESGIPLPLWDFISIVGEKLIGEKIQSDPVWPLLARLAGRSSEEPPGRDFKPPASWQMPPEWLLPFPEETIWIWSAGNRRLRVKHAESFLLLDIPLEGRAKVQLLHEIKAYKDAVQLKLKHGNIACGTEGASPLERWTGWLMPYVLARLKRALGVTGPDISEILCRQRARVRVSATRIDIVLALSKLPVEVRRSGIDRDPGWVPAAGRFIYFHYE